MLRLRSILIRYPALAFAILVAALALRLLVPAGFMPAAGKGAFAIEICSGYGPQMSTGQPTAMAHAMAMPGMAHHDDTATSMSPCAFSDLAQAAIGGVDPILLVAAIAFAVMLGLFSGSALPQRIVPRLRPPLRGPPPFA